MNKTAANVMKSPKEMEELIKKLKIEVSSLKAQLLEAGIAPAAPLKGALAGDITSGQEKALESALGSTSASTKASQEESKDVSNDGLFDQIDKLGSEERKANRESVALTKKEKAEFVKKLDQMSALQDKLTEVETAYEQYKENTTTEILDLKERLE